MHDPACSCRCTITTMRRSMHGTPGVYHDNINHRVKGLARHKDSARDSGCTFDRGSLLYRTGTACCQIALLTPSSCDPIIVSDTAVTPARRTCKGTHDALQPKTNITTVISTAACMRAASDIGRCDVDDDHLPIAIALRRGCSHDVPVE